MKNPILHNIGVFIGRAINGYRQGLGETKGAAGIGHNITQADRTRKVHAFISGLLGTADRHQNKLTMEKLREICRMYDRQSPLFSGILDRGADNIVGENFDFIPKTGDPELNKTVRAYINEQMKKENCDASGVRDFSEILKTVLRDLWTGGDNLLVKRSDGSRLAYESEQKDSPTSGEVNGKRIVMGVELNDLNRPIAYHIKQRRTRGDHGMTKVDAKTTRVPCNNAIFTAYRKRFNQTRGVPFLAAILSCFDRTNNYIDYESLAAEINSMLAWALTKKSLEDADNTLTGVEDNDDTESSFEKVQKLEAGMVIELLEGEDLKMIAAERPGDNFDMFLMTMLRIIGVGIGYPLEVLLLDFSKTNFSSGRLSKFESQRTFRGWQKVLGTHLAMPWYNWKISRGIASGELPAKPELFNASPQWPAWDDIDPKKSAEGNGIAIATGT
ncbi:MAG: phage portal protein [Candidatus Zixiibacteriota bacterium]|nr:MAG: phage portal protein [candidate division Zixibacteria bacterium]